MAALNEPTNPPGLLAEAEAVAELLAHHGYPFVPDDRLGALGKLLGAFIDMLPTDRPETNQPVTKGMDQTEAGIHAS